MNTIASSIPGANAKNLLKKFLFSSLRISVSLKIDSDFYNCFFGSISTTYRFSNPFTLVGSCENY